ncbi:MAG: S41 family peptidase [Planctomycetota bacterium]
MRQKWFWVVVSFAFLVFGAWSLRSESSKTDAVYSEAEMLLFARNEILNRYAEKVDSRQLFYGSIQGMMATLDDYSQFLKPDLYKELRIDTEGEFGGLGIEITQDERGILTVITPIEDTPAFTGGVRAGDRIIKIDGKTTEKLTVTDAVKILRGKPGTAVTITLYRKGEHELRDITLTRDIIRIKSAKGARLMDETNKIGYVRLTRFQADTCAELDQAVNALKKQGMKALVLDLRFNPGGRLDTAVDVADRFLAEGLIVSTKGRENSQNKEHWARKAGTYDPFLVAVLISGRSASASEVVTGALQDNGRAIVVGAKSFGKASVQSIIEFQTDEGMAALKLTTAHYYTPSGKLIHGKGIEPDITVTVTPEDEEKVLEEWRRLRMEEVKPQEKEKDAPKEPSTATGANIEEKPFWEAGDEKKKESVIDRQLETAVNVLRGMMALQKTPVKTVAKP